MCFRATNPSFLTRVKTPGSLLLTPRASISICSGSVLCLHTLLQQQKQIHRTFPDRSFFSIRDMSMKVTAALDTLYSAVYESFTIYLHYIQRLVGKYHVYGIFNITASFYWFSVLQIHNSLLVYMKLSFDVCSFLITLRPMPYAHLHDGAKILSQTSFLHILLGKLHSCNKSQIQ